MRNLWFIGYFMRNCVGYEMLVKFLLAKNINSKQI